MPWSVSDVESHKKGLSDKGKKQWCRIANSVLKKLMEKGMAEKEAAASAIKQANGVVNVNKGEYSVYKNKQKLDYEVKLVVHQEKAHIVVPVVMMVEGVHSGSLGAIYHSIEELGKYPDTWNGIPVVIYHPKKDDEYVSANSPDVIDAVTVGRVYNTAVEGKKLKAEVWLDEDKLNSVSEKTLCEINETKEIEVSLGMYADYDVEDGNWKGEKYSMIARNHRPDHLAILPDEIGACSCADGCGLGANKKEDIEDKQESINGCGNSDYVSTVVVDNVLITKKEVNTMERSKCTPCVEKKVNELIVNSQGRFIESDKVWLETLEESQLDKLFIKEEKKPEVIAQKDEKKPEVIAPVVNELSPEDKAALAYGRKQLKERKEIMIRGIQSNTEKGTWDDASLNTMSEDMLERVYKSVKKEEVVTGNYMANGSIVTNANANEVEPLYPSCVKVEAKN